jgi:hypothetical protein
MPSWSEAAAEGGLTVQLPLLAAAQLDERQCSRKLFLGEIHLRRKASHSQHMVAHT